MPGAVSSSTARTGMRSASRGRAGSAISPSARGRRCCRRPTISCAASRAPTRRTRAAAGCTMRPSTKQRQLLLRAGYAQPSLDFGISKYAANCHLNFLWHRDAIKQAVFAITAAEGGLMTGTPFRRRADASHPSGYGIRATRSAQCADPQPLALAGSTRHARKPRRRRTGSARSAARATGGGGTRTRPACLTCSRGKGRAARRDEAGRRDHGGDRLGARASAISTRRRC